MRNREDDDDDDDDDDADDGGDDDGNDGYDDDDEDDDDGDGRGMWRPLQKKSHNETINAVIANTKTSTGADNVDGLIVGLVFYCPYP